MQLQRINQIFAFLLSVGLHALVIVLAGNHLDRYTVKTDVLESEEQVISLEVTPPSSERTLPEPFRQNPVPAPYPASVPAIQTPPAADRQPAFMHAPAAPTAQEWALAATYTLKNSKRYRYTWGQQVRSMMGTAFEGADQGVVRFRVEIAPDGTLARLDTLWTTSALAEKLAREAIQNMPPLPPTPTGQALIFEKTISFQPHASDGPPLYRDDCLPDPPAFRNPFMWDGKSPQVRTAAVPGEKLDPSALEECLKQLPQDSIEAESAHDQRQLEQWGSGRLGR